MALITDRTSQAISLETVSRRFGTSGEKIYDHAIRWTAPAHPYGFVIQRVRRHTKDNGFTFRGHGNVVNEATYWEVWEIYEDRVYPFRTGVGGNMFIPGASAPTGRDFVWNPTIEEGPCLRMGPGGYDAGAPGAGDFAAAIHDRFTEPRATNNGRAGHFKIYAEVYCVPRTAATVEWVKRAKADANSGAGYLPMFEGDAAAPGPLSMRRYESAEFDLRRGKPHYSRGRAWPGSTRLAVSAPAGQDSDVYPRGTTAAVAD